MLGMSVSTLYRRRAEFPFTVELPGNVVRFHAQGLAAYIAQAQGAGDRRLAGAMNPR
jgi:predicted DNA-binding transcriptional regulator AlpA